MDKVIIDYSRLNAQQTLTQARTHQTAMTGNANFPAPMPDAAAYDALLTGLADGDNDYETTRALLDKKKIVRDNAKRAMQLAMGQRASYVNMAKPGDTAALTSSGLPLRGAVTPVGAMPQVQTLVLESGNHAGSVFADWKSTKGASSYEVETCVGTDPMTATWTRQRTVTRSECEVKGFESGARIWVRVRAVGTAGHGDWSDPATLIVQ